MSFDRARASLIALALLALPSTAGAATRYDPRLRFRTWRTAHFDIHAHQGEEALVVRLASIVERTRTRFEPVLGVPRGRVQVILVDQSDVANGWATPFPYDAIELTAAPPAPDELIGNTTDWLELVFTHEYTHILHLDRSRGFSGGVRRLFGRAPFVFPNALLPIWQIEGLATYEESRQTGEGRVPAGDFRAIVDTASRQGRFAPIDRAGGGLDDWPAGQTAYAYGAYFHQYLADRFGAGRLGALADATAARVPLFGSGAFRRVFGAPADTLWREFEQARARRPAPAGSTDARARRLTQDGFVVSAPRIDAGGAIYYRASNADGFPALMRLDGATRRRLAWRVLGDRTSVRGDWVVFDQVERARSIALVSDLSAVRRDGGDVVRLTRDARAAHPDLSPDGRLVACVVLRPGRRVLALLDFAPDGRPRTPRPLVDDPSADFSGPRWSPDGAQIVVERRRAGLYELVLVSPTTGAVRPLVARTDARVITPSWTPDGTTVLFAANPGDAPFNVFAVDIRTRVVRRMTDSASGAQFPELAPDGSLVYVGYSADGYDLYALPGTLRSAELPAAEFRTVFREPASRAPAEEALRLKADATRPNGRSAEPAAGGGTTYSPVTTLAPTYWQPVVSTDAGETLIGAGTAMSDALGRHSYSASAAWAGARARPDWRVGYVYDRWRPTLFVSYVDDTDPVRGGERRTRELSAGALLPVRRVRWSQTLFAGMAAGSDTFSCATACARASRRDRRSLRAGWLFDSRRTFAYSISTEEGTAVEVASEAIGGARGLDARASATVVDARGFRRVFSRHTVLAVRAAAAWSAGDAAVRRTFSAGGPGPSQPAFGFGRDAIGLLRGFDPQDVLGTHAAVLNVDLRVPVRRVQRGVGTWPLFVRSLHAAVFADAGAAWTAAFRAGDVRRAIGGELALDAVLLHSLRVTFAGGAAWTHDPVVRADRAAPFARVGYAF